MRTTAALGWTALGAIIVAALCFAVVDVTTTAVQWCAQSETDCQEPALAPYTGWFAVGGSIALVACIVPAIAWLALVVRSARASSDDDGDLTAS